MSGNNININERKVGENEVPDEIIELPHQVYDANWRDDIPDEAVDEIKEETSFETFEDEKNYKFGDKSVDKSVEVRLDAFRRKRNQKLGRAVLDLLNFKEAV